ncbi:MAG TPA: hypothetical protein VMT22_00715 [Terriglobales bacterium]|jgi:hypothetical protein|nr:hypothetical protein [Terriglobales bacterium]
MKFSMVPLLLTGQSLSGEARQALRENRLKDVATILMGQYGLSCVETRDLLDVSVCDDKGKALPIGDAVAIQAKF